ncbi:hypothetical protein AMTR_s00052p00189500 [Amborella trichopoda]|uniref:Uncharacterized protein n=1 Tax=Amborella trichopoda TaxID=13333 RepID=U5D2G3_AMBTC|nr:hypothetical protein AMTR_s00052p00189500 [Amborella trichopoda]
MMVKTPLKGATTKESSGAGFELTSPEVAIDMAIVSLVVTPPTEVTLVTASSTVTPSTEVAPILVSSLAMAQSSEDSIVAMDMLRLVLQSLKGRSLVELVCPCIVNC